MLHSYCVSVVFVLCTVVLYSYCAVLAACNVCDFINNVGRWYFKSIIICRIDLNLNFFVNLDGKYAAERKWCSLLNFRIGDFYYASRESLVCIFKNIENLYLFCVTFM